MTIITTAFKKAGEHRLKSLGLPNHPMVVTDHPLASRNVLEVQEMAQRAVDLVAKALVR